MNAISKPKFLIALMGSSFIASVAVIFGLWAQKHLLASSSFQYNLILTILFSLAVLAFLFGYIVWVRLVYFSWKAIQSDNVKFMPLKASLPLIIPFFNLYWMFVVWGEYPAAYNKYVAERDLNVKTMPRHWFIWNCALNVVSLAAPFIPMVGSLIILMDIISIWAIADELTDGVNAVLTHKAECESEILIQAKSS